MPTYLVQVAKDAKASYKTIFTTQSPDEAFKYFDGLNTQAPRRKRIKNPDGKTIKRSMH